MDSNWEEERGAWMTRRERRRRIRTEMYGDMMKSEFDCRAERVVIARGSRRVGEGGSEAWGQAWAEESDQRRSRQVTVEGK
mmetsp:Transcript_10607/g.25180  ORF Transcript_10607/g.25180 Transcript_10607/m.25180 type:complete len:81 (+) Transcript_10607:850-1092(+)